MSIISDRIISSMFFTIDTGKLPVFFVFFFVEKVIYFYLRRKKKLDFKKGKA